jgi:hypothetical protein
MENNLAALLDGGVKPWVGSKDQDANLLYGTAHDWPAYDITKQQKLTGVIKELRFRGKPPLLKIEVDKKLLDVIIAPAPRMEFRGLEEPMLKSGVTVSVVVYRVNRSRMSSGRNDHGRNSNDGIALGTPS